MRKDRLQNINVRRILDRIIDDAEIAKKLRLFTYDDIKGALLSETSESRITEALRILVSEGILRDKSTLLGRPPEYLSGKDEKRTKDVQKGRKSNNYKIILSRSTFEKIFRLYLNDDVKKFLISLYTNNMIKKFGFSVVYDVINPYLEHFDFRQIASNSLLTQSAAIEEYKNQSKLRGEYFSSTRYETDGQSINDINLLDLVTESRKIHLWDERRQKFGSVKGCWIKPIRSNRIKMLSQLDPKKAVNFYRETVQVEIENLFSELSDRSLITLSLYRFMDYDIRLSPFTSYPINSPSDLLFSQPFQRIFDDVYLLDKEDLSMFYQRALIVYNNFGDILFEYFRIIWKLFDI